MIPTEQKSSRVIQLNDKDLTPFSLCKYDESSFLIVDELAHQIALVDLEGNVKWKTGNKTLLKKNKLHYPTDATFVNEKFYITDRYNHRIVVLDVKGDFLFSTGSYGENVDNFNEPFGIYSNKKDRLFVSDYGNQKIKELSLNGDVLSEFGMSGSNISYYESDFFKKQSVFKKWVGLQTRNNTIESMFFRSGFFIGNLEQPKGITIAQDSIIVVDFEGSIQFFNIKTKALLKSLKFSEYPTWIYNFNNEIYLSCEFSKTLWKIDENNKIIPFKTLDYDIGKFIILDNSNLIYVSPWNKKILITDLKVSK